MQHIEHIPTPAAASFCHSHLDVPNMQDHHLASILPLTPSLAPNLPNNEQHSIPSSLLISSESHHSSSSTSPSSSCSSDMTLVNSRQFHLQDFKVLRCLGKGAQGAVFCVRDRITSETMALKVVSKYGRKQRQIRSLLAEQDVLSLLSEDLWFVNLQASWSDTQNFYLAMVGPFF